MKPPSPPTPENWDAASECYDANISDFTGKFADSVVELAEIPDAARALDVAAGSGALTLRLAPRCASLLAADYSRGMLDVLQRKLDARGIVNVQCHGPIALSNTATVGVAVK